MEREEWGLHSLRRWEERILDRFIRRRPTDRPTDRGQDSLSISVERAGSKMELFSAATSLRSSPSFSLCGGEIKLPITEVCDMTVPPSRPIFSLLQLPAGKECSRKRPNQSRERVSMDFVILRDSRSRCSPTVRRLHA